MRLKVSVLMEDRDQALVSDVLLEVAAALGKIYGDENVVVGVGPEETSGAQKMPEYILESPENVFPKTYRILKHRATAEFSEYRSVVETRSANMALELMRRLMSRELTL